ncbi:hypothetical protein [Microbispora bryophytorum]|uniref:hypothetical protein n=1 Tax=Microbispora bryophytorum TaxID=1460882 RepID=UPI0033C1FF07
MVPLACADIFHDLAQIGRKSRLPAGSSFVIMQLRDRERCMAWSGVRPALFCKITNDESAGHMWALRQIT